MGTQRWIALLTLAFAGSAFGQFQPLSQKRYVYESVGEEFFLNQAADFGAFDAAFTAVSQNSSISTDSILGIGSAGPDPFFSINSATSFFEVVFEVQAETEFLFIGSMTTGIEGGSGLVQLSSSSGDIVNLLSSGGETFNWSESGSLAPDQYTLQVFVSNSIGGGLSTFDFSLTVPCPSGLLLLAGASLLSAGRRRR